MMMNKTPAAIALPYGQLNFPAFLPDATYGFVRSVDSADLERCHVPALVMNTFHLMQRPGSSVVRALGGLHRMAAWPKPIVTDSGGFQAYSLIRQNTKYGSMSEKAMQLQLRFDTDIAICLDECTHVDAPYAEQELAVQRTIKWARRCKDEFERIISQRKDASR